MRSILKITLFVSLVFSAASCSEDNAVWKKFVSNDGGFSIMMPANNLKKSEKKEYTVFGKQTTHFISWRPSSFAIDKFKLFQVSYTECPARIASDSTLLNSTLDSAINIRKKDFTEGDIEVDNADLNGYPSRSFIYVNKESDVAIVKECIVNNRKYDITVVTKQNYKTNSEISTFFSSFQSFR